MKRFLFITLAITASTQTIKADNIDFWQVYYNATMIREFNRQVKNEIVLKLDSIKNNDSIIVKYFRDTPCSDCITHLAIEDGKHHAISTAQGKGTFNPISFAIKDLRAAGNEYFEIYYYEGEIKSRSEKILIFRIKFQ